MARNRTGAFVVAGIMAMTLALAGCGSSQASSASSAESSAAPSGSSILENPTGAISKASGVADAVNDAVKSTETAATEIAGNGSGSYVGEDAAIRAALAHAGVSETDCTELSAQLDTSATPAHYDVEFRVGTAEYDYDVDAATGNVVYFETEAGD